LSFEEKKRLSENLDRHATRMQEQLHRAVISRVYQLASGQRTELEALERQRKGYLLLENDPLVRRILLYDIAIIQKGLLAREQIPPGFEQARDDVLTLKERGERNRDAPWIANGQASPNPPSETDIRLVATAIANARNYGRRVRTSVESADTSKEPQQGNGRVMVISPDESIRYLIGVMPRLPSYGREPAPAIIDWVKDVSGNPERRSDYVSGQRRFR
jgi:hypothetical protein